MSANVTAFNGRYTRVGPRRNRAAIGIAFPEDES